MSDGSITVAEAPTITEKKSAKAEFSNLSFDQQPQDVDQLAYIVQKNTDILSSEIINTRLPNLEPGQKIIIVVGEIHENGLDIAFIGNLLHELTLEGFNCAYGVEWPPNNIDMQIDDVIPENYANITKLKETLALPEHKALRNDLSADTTPIRTINARLTRTVLHQMTDNHNIPVFCIDAQRNWEDYIKNERKWQDLLQTDPETADAIAEAAKILGLSPSENGYPPINALHQFGMFGRNIYGVNAVEDILAEHPEIDILVIASGLAHTAGNDNLTPEPSPYKHSLSSLFKEKRISHSVIVANLYTSDAEKKERLPEAALHDLDILTLEHRTNLPFNSYIPPDAKPETDNPKDYNDRSDIQETNYLTSMTAHFPWISETLDGKKPFELYLQRRAELFQKLGQVINKNNLLLQTPDTQEISSSDDPALIP